MSQFPDDLNLIKPGEFLQDAHGNKYEFSQQVGGNALTIRMRKAESTYSILFGEVELDTNTLVKKESEENRYRHLDAWTVPKVLAVRATTVIYQTPTAHYMTTRKVLLQWGTELSLGNEDKIALPVSYWSVQ